MEKERPGSLRNQPAAWVCYRAVGVIWTGHLSPGRQGGKPQLQKITHRAISGLPVPDAFCQRSSMSCRGCRDHLVALPARGFQRIVRQLPLTTLPSAE